MASDLSTRTVSPHRDQTQWFAYKYAPNPEKEGRTHHGSAYKIPFQDALGVHGGVGLKGRVSTTSVYTEQDSILSYPEIPPEDIGARCCHTITSFGNVFQFNLLVGGRTSPTNPLKDCWLQSSGGKWERVHDLPEPRFRHRAVAVVLPYDQYGVVVFGGKTSPTKIAIETLLWDKQNGWQVLRNVKADPMPRFGASFVRIGFNHGLLLGGMRQDGVVCQGLWKWRLIIRDNKVMGISFKTSTAMDASAGIWPWLNRFGASYSIIRDELLVIGGIAKHGCIPKDYEILSVVGSFSAFNDYEKEMELRVACVLPTMEPTTPRPFLIGHSTHYTAKATTLIVGGGATCFSFGAYWNTGCWLLYDREANVSSRWAWVKPEAPKSLPPPQLGTDGPSSVKSHLVERVKLSTEQDFIRIIQDGIPRLLTDLEFGPGPHLWTPSYLLSKVSSSKSVVVHSAPGRTMNFQRKDFAYKTVPFHNFLHQLQSDPSAHMYLRSISSTHPSTVPADFSTDWPEFSTDFRLPPLLSFVGANEHSSPLRISGNVNMWLHYDVMANVLFQIRGTRKLILFPPSDLKRLSFPTGSTSSTIDIFQSKGLPGAKEDEVVYVPHTHPHVAILRPGEVLFIPPLWAHTATPMSPRVSPQEPQRPTTKSASNTTSSSTTSTSTSDSLHTAPTAPTPSTTSTSHPEPNDPSSSTSAVKDNDPTTSHINISLNIFFRTLSPQKYAAGRDVYGNRDLAAYEDGRRDVEKIVRRFVTATAAATSSRSRPNGGGENGDTASGDRKKKGDEKLANDESIPSTTTTTTTSSSSAGTEPKPELDMGSIPKDVVKAYLERLASELQERADKL